MRERAMSEKRRKHVASWQSLQQIFSVRALVDIGRECVIWSGVSTIQKPLYEKVEYIIPPWTNKTWPWFPGVPLLPRFPLTSSTVQMYYQTWLSHHSRHCPVLPWLGCRSSALRSRGQARASLSSLWKQNPTEYYRHWQSEGRVWLSIILWGFIGARCKCRREDTMGSRLFQYLSKAVVIFLCAKFQ